MSDAVPPPERGPRGTGEPRSRRWELEDVYDPETLALIEAPARRPPSGPPMGFATVSAPVGRDGGPASAGGDAALDPGAPDASAVAEPAEGSDGDDADGADLDGSTIVRRGRAGVAGLLMAGMMAGVGEVLDPDRFQPETVEFTPDQPDPAGLPVQFVHVPGDPQASRLIIRPWLFRR